MKVEQGAHEELFDYFNVSFDGWHDNNFTTTEINKEMSGKHIRKF